MSGVQTQNDRKLLAFDQRVLGAYGLFIAFVCAYISTSTFFVFSNRFKKVRENNKCFNVSIN